jgi:hypothetical protein
VEQNETIFSTFYVDSEQAGHKKVGRGLTSYHRCLCSVQNTDLICCCLFSEKYGHYYQVLSKNKEYILLMHRAAFTRYVMQVLCILYCRNQTCRME